MLLLDEFYRRMVDPLPTVAVTALARKHSNMRFACLQWRYVLNGGAPVLGVVLGEVQ